MNPAPRILVIEDDDGTASEIVAILRDAGFRPDRQPTLALGIRAATGKRFAAIVLDRMLPDGDGIEAIDALRAALLDVPILMLSALGRAADRVEGLEQGVDDYLAKPFDPEELRARIRAMLRRRAVQIEETDLFEFGPLQIRCKARTVHVGRAHVPLSPREFDLLAFFARNSGNVVTRMQLLEHVWNLHFDPQTNVVDVHVSRLRRKLEAALPGPVLYTERGEGYVFDPARKAARAGNGGPRDV